MPTKPKAGYTLVLDQGSQSSRAIVYNAAGDELRAAKVPVSTHRDSGERVEQDPAEIVDSLNTAIAEAVSGIDPQLITQAGLATQRSSIVCWNHVTGETLTPVISWQDRRAADWLAEFDAHSARVKQLTGLMLSPHYGVSKMRWCLNELPAVQRCHERGELTIGSLSSYLQYALVDEQPLCIDPANASRTLLYDCHQMGWSDELLQLFGIPETVLPACVPTSHHFGYLRTAGLHVPLSLTTGDQSAALFASGDVDPLTVYANLGTGAFVQRSSGNQVEHLEGLLSSVVYQDDAENVAGNNTGRQYVIEGTVNGAGSALNWVTNELQLERKDVVAQLPQWLIETSTPPLFLNGVSGLGAPWWVADFPTQFLGDGTAAEKVVAVIESIIFLIQVNFEIMNQANDSAERWIISGGLANLDGVCQRLADLSGLIVVRPDINEGTSRGVWHLLNRYNDTRQPKHTETVFEPQENQALHERYSRWRSAMAEVKEAN
jgi:glycerol kinase